MPLIRRLPKRGFSNNAHKTVYAIVNVDDLEQFEPGIRVNRELLEQRGLVNGRFDGIKILGRGKLTKNLTVEAHKFSATARQQIEAAGGSVVPLP
jgi:large subunit ribosomal protein L15